MKRLICMAAMALLGLAITTACDKDDATPSENIIPDFSITELAGTSWTGRYMDSFNYNGQHQMLFTWTLDFNADGKGIVMMEISSPALEEIVEEFEMTYSYDGSSLGEINYTGHNFEYRSDFIVDALNRSLDVNLWIHYYLSEDDDEPVQFGGRTTLYKVEK